MMSGEDNMTVDRKRRADHSSNGRNTTSVSAEGTALVSQTIDRADQGDFLDQTIAVWQPYAGRPLTREDAREITHNVVGFFRVLREWAEEDLRSAASADSSPASAPSLRGETK
jgi:hypothetical protein